MSDASTATDKEIEQLKEHIAEGAEQTKSYLTQLQAKLNEYDAQYKLSDTASAYLQAGLDKAHTSVDELKNLGAQIKASTQNTSHAVVQSAQAALAKVQSSLDDLSAKAADYDQKAKSAITSTASATRDTVSSSIETIVVSSRAQASSSIEKIAATLESIQSKITETATSYGETAFAYTGAIVKKAEEVDEKLGLSGTVAGAAAAVSEKVVALDKQYGVSEKAVKMDEKVSGGLGVSLLGKGAGLLNQGVDYVTSTLQSAKEAADKKK